MILSWNFPTNPLSRRIIFIHLLKDDRIQKGSSTLASAFPAEQVLDDIFTIVNQRVNMVADNFVNKVAFVLLRAQFRGIRYFKKKPLSHIKVVFKLNQGQCFMIKSTMVVEFENN